MLNEVLPFRLQGDVRVVANVDAGLERAWAAYTDPNLRRRWFRLPGKTLGEDLDIREGGHHFLTGSFPLEDRTEDLDARARFLEIAPMRRLVWTAEVRVNGLLRSASLCVTEFREASGTELVHEEQFTVFAGDEEQAAAGAAERRGGVRLQLNGWRAVAADADPSRAGVRSTA